jgi:hypothetical protein
MLKLPTQKHFSRSLSRSITPNNSPTTLLKRSLVHEPCTTFEYNLAVDSAE